MIKWSEERAYGPCEHALVINLMGLNYSFHLFFIKLHSLENDSHQVLLNARIFCDEVWHQNVLQILWVDWVLALEGQLFILRLVISLQSIVLTLQLIKLRNRRLKFVLKLFLFLSGKLLVFNELVACGLPFDLLLFQIFSKFLLLLQESNNSSVVEFHDVIAELPSHGIWLRFDVVDLRHAQLNLIESLSQLLLTLLLFALERFVDFGLDLVRFANKFIIELILLLHLKLDLFLVDIHFLLDLLVALIALLSVFVCPPKPLFILVHAQGQAVFELLLFCKNCGVIDLLNYFPFLAQLCLYVSDHIISIPLTTMLHILDKRVPYFTDFYSS